jgi:hypothetical protein
MAIDIIEDLENANLGRPLKGLMLENGIHIFDTKQEILDQQSLSLDRVENAVIFARDIKKFLIFDETGENFEEKDIPGGQDLDEYVKKYTRADLDYIRVAYGGNYEDERNFYPAQLNQDSNGWTQLGFTGYMQFQSIDKATGEKGDKVLELRNNRVINKVQPFFNDDKMATRTNNHIATTSSISDLIMSNNESVNQWISDNPDYTPTELLAEIFSSKVLGFSDWQAEITLSNNDFNGTTPSKFGKWIIRRSSDSTRSYMYIHLKESEDVYRAPYVSGAAPVWSMTAYISDIDEVVDDKLESIFNPSPPVTIELKGPDFHDYGYNISYGSIDYNGNYVRFPRWANTISETVHYDGNNSSYILFREEDIARMLGRELDSSDGELGIDLTEAVGGLGRYGQALPNNSVLGAKWDYSGRAIAKLIPTNPDGSSDGTEQDANNPYLFLKDDGSLTEEPNEAKLATYTKHQLGKVDQFIGRKWGFALRRGYITDNKEFVYNAESNYYVCVFNIKNPIAASKHHTFNFSLTTAKIYETAIDAEMDYNPITLEDDVSSLIEKNNDDIVTPEHGEVFHFIDENLTDGYGAEGGTKQTYWSPNDGLQKDLLLSKIDYSKVFCIHKEANTQNMFLMLHESYAAQIYNRDVTGVNELTMLFGPNARSRFSSYNTTSPVGSVWNWNGQAIPEDNDPNELQPTVWITPEGNETTEWSANKEIVATCCYSSGILANDGSAILRRGDVRFNPATKTSAFEADNVSPFYVLPIRAGGGTFGDIKVFSFFMSRRSKETFNWDSYIFEDSADCIGNILKIAYDAAIELEAHKEVNQEEQLLAGMAGGQLFVNQIKVG